MGSYKECGSCHLLRTTPKCSTSHGNSEPWSGYFGCSHCMATGGPRLGMEASSRLLLLALVDSVTVSTYLNFCAALMLALDNSCSNEGSISFLLAKWWLSILVLFGVHGSNGGSLDFSKKNSFFMTTKGLGCTDIWNKEVTAYYRTSIQHNLHQRMRRSVSNHTIKKTS